MLLIKKNKTESEQASGFHSRQTFYMDVFISVTFANFILSHPKCYKYALLLFSSYLFHNDDLKSSKRQVTLNTIIK